MNLRYSYAGVIRMGFELTCRVKLIYENSELLEQNIM